MKKLLLFATIGTIVLFSCQKPNQKIQNQKENLPIPDLAQFVNPMVGTKNMGHTYPGATTPFGMVQLSPETNIEPYSIDGEYNGETYRYCSGYQYDDHTIFGFAHTHFSGVGHSDLGDFLVMPTTGDLVLNPGEVNNPGSGYHSQFSHETETAEPGYYKVHLEDYDIKAELTASDRVGFHQYSFPASEDAHIILDLVYNIYNYDEKNVWTFIRVENDSLVTGFRQTKGWARNRKVYFAMAFSKPFETYGHKKYDKLTYNGFYRRFEEEENFPEMAGRNIRAYFNFKTQKDEKIKIKFALSSVSTEGAIKNLRAEIPGWNFKQIKEETRQRWNRELAKVQVETSTPEEKQTFYTAMYHSMLSPIIYEDVDGRYLGLDQNIHQSEGFTNYTIFSLWDTYRALHPLFNIFHPQKNNDMVKSMLAHQEQSVHHMLPIWSHYANENWCMIGYHAVSVIADAVAKGNTDADLNKTLDACISTSNVGYFNGIDEFVRNGYVSEEKSDYSVSLTLEYAYNDWCIAQIAQKLGKTEVYNQYLKRSENFKNIYDKEIGFMRPKLKNGEWRKNFDPMDTHGQGFIEGNAWNYGLYVPHEIDTMIEMMGGKEKFAQSLDKIFTTEIAEKYIENNEDITRDGIIGNYVHGNEPGHHIPYLYNWTGQPWKTQERVRMIMKTMYSSKEDGLCGNDDAGQMSAWYIFSSLGFYPVLPGADEYSIGSPMVKKANLYLDNGKTLVINTKNQSPENVYVEKVEINGKKIDGLTLKHSDIMNGGEIKFYMTNTPAK
ncbi:GH92 family glycosyl hydrolase [Maribellus maritimus]|uniref:GH92 family glycosyl hydrolase n=1 Tax=Maribellus maritimus TaxID=2870838 RepID=UPI001EEB2992|nr:GH92 family glycosyl hydrolase [Maribellus maritimus]MCG6188917.1 GH92 family glycosyl hydrolase [Maribellus maritimus]